MNQSILCHSQQLTNAPSKAGNFNRVSLPAASYALMASRSDASNHPWSDARYSWKRATPAVTRWKSSHSSRRGSIMGSEMRGEQTEREEGRGEGGDWGWGGGFWGGREIRARARIGNM